MGPVDGISCASCFLFYILYLLCFSPNFYYTFMEVIFFPIYLSIIYSITYLSLYLPSIFTSQSAMCYLFIVNKNIPLCIPTEIWILELSFQIYIVEWLFFFCHYNCCWYMKLFGNPIQGATHWRTIPFHQEIKRTTVYPHNHL